MKRFLLLLPLLLLAQEDHKFIRDSKVQFQENLAQHRATYRSNKAESRARKNEAKAQQKAKLYLNTNQLSRSSSLPTRLQKRDEDFFKKFDTPRDDKLFKKVLIKSRSRKNPEKYHYTVIKKRSDLKKAGVVVGKKSKIKKVYNYVEVKNTIGKTDNLGIKLEKGSRVKEAVNIVNIKHSKIKSKNPNAGIIIKSKRAPSKLYNEVELQDSKTGEW